MPPRQHLTDLEQALLYAVLRLSAEGETAYGVTIAHLIEERIGRRVSPGAIYIGLERLEQRRLVRSVLGPTSPQRGGKRKRIYRLLPAGLKQLREARAMLEALAGGLDELLERR